MLGEAIERRTFISLLGGAAAWPLTASAQQAGGKIVTIGVLAIEPWPPIDTFQQALDDLGYIEGKNVRFEYRYAKGHNERLPELANASAMGFFGHLAFFGQPPKCDVPHTSLPIRPSKSPVTSIRQEGARGTETRTS